MRILLSTNGNRAVTAKLLRINFIIVMIFIYIMATLLIANLVVEVIYVGTIWVYAKFVCCGLFIYLSLSLAIQVDFNRTFTSIAYKMEIIQFASINWCSLFVYLLRLWGLTWIANVLLKVCYKIFNLFS